MLPLDIFFISHSVCVCVFLCGCLSVCLSISPLRIIPQIPNYHGGKSREEAADRPATWSEVVFKCVPLQEGEEDTNEVQYVLLLSLLLVVYWFVGL
jgi:hypothetical protein